MPTESDLRRKMQDLGKALAKAMASSPEVGDALRRIQDEGFSLSMGISPESDRSTVTQVQVGTKATPPPPEPAFKLDGSDVSFLRSMRIDPTRSVRRRR